jgi:tetratricopeptide (TPR) repeat protein
VTGLVVDDAGFEVLAGEQRIGPRRVIQPDDVELLTGLARRYVRAVQAGSRPEEFIAIGRELFTWLDGDSGQFTRLLEKAERPLVFEVQGPRTPSGQAWAVLRAPFELLARPVSGPAAESAGGFLAEDAIIRFCVARRLGGSATPPPLDAFRLGLAFMASAPRGQHELDYEAEEAAILGAVGENRVDLVVDDTGDPEQLAHRLAELGGMPAVHLSCHGVNSYRARAGQPGVPALMMEDDAGAGRPTTAADLVGLLTVRPRLLFVSACLTATGADATGHLPPGDKHKAEPTGANGAKGEPGDNGLGKPGDSDEPTAGSGHANGSASGAEALQDAEPGGGHAGGSADLESKSSAGDDDKAGARANGNGGLVAHSLATELVSAGMPAVIGWDGSVGDWAATLFAERLYRGLADRADLAVAVGDARRALLDSDEPHVREDWHLARLWLGPDGGGSLVGGSKKRSLVTASHGTKTFLDQKSLVPVAAAQMFVGRRHELQRSLRVLRGGEPAGVLLHGQGRLGKSSLAARIADRMPGHAMAVVFGDYSALGILDAVSVAVRANKEARELIESRLAEVRRRPEAIEAVLVDLLNGPLAQASEGGQRPLLLIIDDLEQVLVANPAGPHRVAAGNAPVLAAVLRAFDPAETDSRLLVTSRFTFTLDGLESRLADVQLPPLTEVSQRKLQRRQQAVAPAERLAGRGNLADRAVSVSRGNPGLQDLIGLRLVYGERVSTERAEAAVAGMEVYLQRGDLPAEPEVRAFLEILALDALLDEAGPSNVTLLRAATLSELPAPESVIETLAGEVGGSVTRLRGLGLLDPYVDLYDPTVTALAVNPLASGRVEPLRDSERAVLAASSIGPLFTAWGGTEGSSRRDEALDLQLTRLALLADAPAPVAACAAYAVEVLRSGPAADARRLGQDAIALLDRHGQGVPILLLRKTADAALTSGDGEAGEAMLDRAVRQAESGDIQGVDSLDQARVIFEQAKRLVTRGDVEQAERLLRQAHWMFASGGSEREASVTMGSIADITYRRGDYDEALRIRHEISLPAYERLGDTRAIAVAWGDIADITYERGDYDEALRIRHEIQLPVYQRLGDTRSIAVTWGKIADITYERGDYDEALRIRREIELPVYQRLGDTRSIAVTWGEIADITYQRGDYDEALRIRREIELPAYERLGDIRATAIAWGDIADIYSERGNYDAAAELQAKRLQVNRQLGDLDGIAAADWGLARIDLAREDYQAAFPRLVEAFQILRQLQRPDGIANVGIILGQFLVAGGANENARKVFGDSLAAARKLEWDDMAREIEELIESLPAPGKTDRA